MNQNLPPAGHPDWVGRAIAAVSAFEPDLRYVGLSHLLSMWKYANQLTLEQAREVVAHFTTDLESTQPLPVEPAGTRTLTTAGGHPATDPTQPHPPEAVRIRADDNPATRPAGTTADCGTCGRPLVWSRNAWRHTVGGE